MNAWEGGTRPKCYKCGKHGYIQEDYCKTKRHR